CCVRSCCGCWTGSSPGPRRCRSSPSDAGLSCTVTARTFKGTHVAVHLQPADGPRLEAACALREAPEVGASVGVEFDATETVVLG
ncbi:TOBE domain-containing protein, partial [Streptomyces sp. NPDC003233]